MYFPFAFVYSDLFVNERKIGRKENMTYIIFKFMMNHVGLGVSAIALT